MKSPATEASVENADVQGQTHWSLLSGGKAGSSSTAFAQLLDQRLWLEENKL